MASFRKEASRTGKLPNYVSKKPARVSQPVAGFLLRSRKEGARHYRSLSLQERAEVRVRGSLRREFTCGSCEMGQLNVIFGPSSDTRDFVADCTRSKPPCPGLKR